MSEREVLRIIGGEQVLTKFRPQQSFKPNDFTPYRYRCNISALRAIADGVVNKNVPVDVVHQFFSTPVQIDYMPSNDRKKVEDSGFVPIEKAILETVDVDGVINPSRGTLKRLVNAGVKQVDVYLTTDRNSDRKNPICTYGCECDSLENCKCAHPREMHRIEGAVATEDYKRQVSVWSQDLEMSNNIVESAIKDIPVAKSLYVGDQVHLLDRKPSSWIGYEVNPAASQVSSSLVTEIVEHSDGFNYCYMKGGVPVRRAYKKKVKYYRIHGNTFLLARGRDPNRYAAGYNVARGEYNYFDMSVSNVPYDIHFLGANNLYRCDGKAEDIRYRCLRDGVVTQAMIQAVRCDHGKIVDIKTPAYELSTRMMMVAELGGGCEHKKVMCSSSRPLVCPMQETDSKFRFRPYVVSVPTRWQFMMGKWKCFAYPGATRINGEWYFRGDRVAIPEWCESTMVVKKGVIVKTGVETTIFEPDEKGDCYHSAYFAAPIVSSAIITTRTRVDVRSVRFGDYFVTKCAGSEEGRSVLKKQKGWYGDFSKPYDVTFPASRNLIFLPVTTTSLTVVSVGRVMEQDGKSVIDANDNFSLPALEMSGEIGDEEFDLL